MPQTTCLSMPLRRRSLSSVPSSLYKHYDPIDRMGTSYLTKSHPSCTCLCLLLSESKVCRVNGLCTHRKLGLPPAPTRETDSIRYCCSVLSVSVSTIATSVSISQYWTSADADRMPVKQMLPSTLCMRAPDFTHDPCHHSDVSSNG